MMDGSLILLNFITMYTTMCLYSYYILSTFPYFQYILITRIRSLLFPGHVSVVLIESHNNYPLSS